MARKKRKNHPAQKEAFTPSPRERALVVREDTFALQKAMTALAAQEKPRRQKKQQRRRRRTGWLIAALLLAGALCTGVFVLDIPHWQQLDPAKLSRLSQTSRLYDASGALISYTIPQFENGEMRSAQTFDPQGKLIAEDVVNEDGSILTYTYND